MKVSLIFFTLIVACAAKSCNQHTNCDDCKNDLLCQWCGKDYYSPPGENSNCHTLGSPFGCLSWINHCGATVPLTNDTAPVIAPGRSRSRAPSPTKSPLPSLAIFASPWMSTSLTHSISISASETASKSYSESPTMSRSISDSPSSSVSSSPAHSISASISETSSITVSASYTPSLSESSSVTKSRSFSPTVSMTPSASLVCLVHYWTDCNRDHPGCREGFSSVNDYTLFEVEDSNGWRQSMCLWPLLAHWKCCMNQIATIPNVTLVNDDDIGKQVPSRAQQHHERSVWGSVIAPMALIGMVVMFASVLIVRQRLPSPLASQDATNYEPQP